MSDVDYNLLQSLYTWPNVLLCVFCGILCDKFGINKILVSSWTLTIIGILLSILSAQYAYVSYWILCVGRIIIGIGNESMGVAIKVFVWNNFLPNQHGKVFGVSLASTSLAQSINSIFIYQFYKFTNASIQFTLALPVIIAPVLSLPLFTYIMYNSYQEKQPKELKQTRSSESDTTNLIKKEQKMFKISDVKSLSFCYWIFLISVCFFEVSVQTFKNIGVSFYHHMYGYAYSLSSTLHSIPSFAAVIVMPLCGYITDKYGMKCRLIICSGLIVFICHLSFGWLHINIIITIATLCIFGVGYSIAYPVIWATIPLLVNRNIVATGLGILTSLRFISLSTGYMIVGILTKPQSDNDKYKNVQYFELLMGLLSIMFAFVLLNLDSKNQYKLYYPSHKQSIKNNQNDIKNTKIELNA